MQGTLEIITEKEKTEKKGQLDYLFDVYVKKLIALQYRLGIDKFAGLYNTKKEDDKISFFIKGHFDAVITVEKWEEDPYKLFMDALYRNI
jgi:hypothetical protein